MICLDTFASTSVHTIFITKVNKTVVYQFYRECHDRFLSAPNLPRGVSNVLNYLYCTFMYSLHCGEPNAEAIKYFLPLTYMQSFSDKGKFKTVAMRYTLARIQVHLILWTCFEWSPSSLKDVSRVRWIINLLANGNTNEYTSPSVGWSVSTEYRVQSILGKLSSWVLHRYDSAWLSCKTMSTKLVGYIRGNNFLVRNIYTCRRQCIRAMWRNANVRMPE